MRKMCIIMILILRDTYDKMRADLRLMKEEAQRIETSRAPKVSDPMDYLGF